jgi:hypothetical protein
MEDAILIDETGFPPQVTDEWPAELVERLVVYKGVKNAAIYGVDWQP